MTGGKRRVGIVGFGGLGQFLVKGLLTDARANDSFELGFVWNRTIAKVRDESESLIGVKVPEECILENLEEFESRKCDLIVEVAHPKLYEEFGERFLASADVFVGSPTALAEQSTYDRLYAAASTNSNGNGLYLPAGALWGSMDIAKMGAKGSIAELTISMRKPGTSFKLEEPLKAKLDAFLADPEAKELVLYDGPARGLCPLAPNNVNTMACLAIASGPTMGFDKCRGVLIADKTIEAHIIEVELAGHPVAARGNDQFRINQRRYNPCDPNVVTATATFPSFLASLMECRLRRGCGTHIV